MTEESVEESVEIAIRPQNEFPLMEEYEKKFEITDDTIFALFPYIYSNNSLPRDILIHEGVHLKQQQKIGVTEWVYDFLEYPQKRLEFELEAYQVQLRSIKDRNQRDKRRRESARNLSSGLYGNICSYNDAFKMLKT